MCGRGSEGSKLAAENVTVGRSAVQAWLGFEASFSEQVRQGRRDLLLLRWGQSGVFSGAFVVPSAGTVHVHSGRWACAMINAVSGHHLSGQYDAWLYASDVVRPYPWQPYVSGGHCAVSLLVPTAPAAGARCTWLLPTPYELMSARRSSKHQPPSARPHSVLSERIPILFFRAGWARNRRAIFELGGQPHTNSWLNASVVRHEQVPESEFLRYRYLLDVGGVSGTTWSALRWKLLSGSLVFKVTPTYPPLAAAYDLVHAAVSLCPTHVHAAVSLCPTHAGPPPLRRWSFLGSTGGTAH